MLCRAIEYSNMAKMERKNTKNLCKEDDVKEQQRQRQIQHNVLKIVLITLVFTVITVIGSLLFDVLWR